MSATTCGIYLRISQDRDGEALGVERQEETCRALAEKLGWTVSEVYEDNDFSAYNGKPRPAYLRLLKDIEDGKIAGLLAWHPDRLTRHPIELEHIIAVVDRANLKVHTVESGDYDLSTPGGRATARTLGAWARYESEHKGRRIAAARKQAAKAGKHHGGVRPYGYEKDGMTLRPVEAAEIARVADSILAGMSLRSLVQDLNSRRISTASGRTRWTSMALRDILLSPRAAGLSSWHGEIVGKALWPAMVEEDKWRAVGAILTNPARRTSPMTGGAIKWLGSGIYICGVCGERKLRVGGNSARRTYRCGNRDIEKTTGHVTREATALDNLVEQLAVARLLRPDAAQIFSRTKKPTVDIDSMRIEKIELEELLDEQSVLHARREITTRQMITGSEVMKKRLDELDLILADQVEAEPLIELSNLIDLHKVWFGSKEGDKVIVEPLPLAVRRAVVDRLMDVTVLKADKGRFFNPDFIKIDWKR